MPDQVDELSRAYEIRSIHEELDKLRSEKFRRLTVIQYEPPPGYDSWPNPKEQLRQENIEAEDSFNLNKIKRREQLRSRLRDLNAPIYRDTNKETIEQLPEETKQQIAEANRIKHNGYVNKGIEKREKDRTALFLELLGSKCSNKNCTSGPVSTDDLKFRHNGNVSGFARKYNISKLLRIGTLTNNLINEVKENCILLCSDCVDKLNK